MKLKDIKEKADEIKKKLGTLYLAFKHPKTPWYAKILIISVIAYALSPIDFIPDFIPIIGYLDDLLLIPFGITLSIKLIPKEVMRECEENNKNIGDMKSIGVYGAISVVIIWILIIYLLIRKFYH